MSIHKRTDRGGKWQVKWKIAGKQHSRMFDRKGEDAITFDAEIKRRRQLGPKLAAEMEREVMTLIEYVEGPWRPHSATLGRSPPATSTDGRSTSTCASYGRSR